MARKQQGIIVSRWQEGLCGEDYLREPIIYACHHAPMAMNKGIHRRYLC
jgi:hypothetical protein